MILLAVVFMAAAGAVACVAVWRAMLWTRAEHFVACDLRCDRDGRVGVGAEGLCQADPPRMLVGDRFRLVIGRRLIRMVVETSTVDVHTGLRVWSAIDEAHRLTGLSPRLIREEPRPSTPIHLGTWRTTRAARGQ